MPYDFSGKTVIITGSTTEIGSDLAVQLVKRGANVVIAGRNEELLDDLVEKCREVSAEDLKQHKVVADLRNDEDLRRIVEETVVCFGSIDVLINNVNCNKSTSFWDDDFIDSFEEVINLNLRSVLQLIKLCSPYLIQSKGSIVNVAPSPGIQSVSHDLIPWHPDDPDARHDHDLLFMPHWFPTSLIIIYHNSSVAPNNRSMSSGILKHVLQCIQSRIGYADKRID